MGLLFAALSGILMGLVLVTLTVGFKCEHVLAGVGINIFASGITIVLLEMIWGTKGKSSMVAGLGMLRVPVISKIPVIGDIIGTISPCSTFWFSASFFSGSSYTGRRPA